jgi:uncharacterized protein YlbG (UPF0298 family)
MQGHSGMSSQQGPSFLNVGALQINKGLENSHDSMPYFLEIEASHPISNKLFYSITYSSSVRCVEQDQRYNQKIREFSDSIMLGEARKCFIDHKEIAMPDISFILKVKVTLPSVQRTKQYTCVVYTVAEQNPLLHSSNDNFKEFSLDLDIDEECQMSFKFRPFEVNSQTETGQAVLNALYPRESKQFLDSIHLKRVIMKSAECKVYMNDKDRRNAALEEIYHDICDETSRFGDVTVNNTQNNYYYHTEKNGEFFLRGDLESTKMTKSGMQMDNYSRNISNDLNPGSRMDSMDEKSRNPPKASSKKGSVCFQSKKHSFMEILKDQQLLKHYANTLQKTNSIQQIVASMTKEELQNTFSMLEIMIRDICKNKYGNYVIQIFAKNMPEEKIPDLLAVVRDFNLVTTSFKRDNLSPKRHVRHPRGYWGS